MSLIRYRAYPLMNLQQQINRMFDDFDRVAHGGGEGLGGGMFAPAMDVKEDGDGYTVHLEVPGVRQEDLSLMLQDSVLTVRGRKEQANEVNEGQFRRVERSYGSFARSITLPRPVDSSKVEAHLEDGVLRIHLPKLEEARPRQINIGASHNTRVPVSNSQDSTEATSATGGSQMSEQQTKDEALHGGSGGLETHGPGPTQVGDTSIDDPIRPEDAQGISREGHEQTGPQQPGPSGDAPTGLPEGNPT